MPRLVNRIRNIPNQRLWIEYPDSLFLSAGQFVHACSAVNRAAFIVRRSAPRCSRLAPRCAREELESVGPLSVL